MKVRALDDNPGHWEKGEIFEAHKDGEGYCYINCHAYKSSPDNQHTLLDLDGAYASNPADCPDFEVIP